MLREILLLSTLALASCAQSTNEQRKDLVLQENPSYIVVNDESQSKESREVLKRKSEKVAFPLSTEDEKRIQILEAKFDAEENCAGLAAPQIGIGKQIIIFAAPDMPELKKWRPDLTQTMPKTIWINPSYKGIGEEKHEDYEGCFSVAKTAGPVARFKKIRYQAYLRDGSEVSGEAEGFVARIIQHEIDHINGTLCIDKMDKDKIMTMDEYRKMRAEKMASEDKSG